MAPVEDEVTVVEVTAMAAETVKVLEDIMDGRGFDKPKAQPKAQLHKGSTTSEIDPSAPAMLQNNFMVGSSGDVAPSEAVELQSCGHRRIGCFSRCLQRVWCCKPTFAKDSESTPRSLRSQPTEVAELYDDEEELSEDAASMKMQPSMRTHGGDAEKTPIVAELEDLEGGTKGTEENPVCASDKQRAACWSCCFSAKFRACISRRKGRLASQSTIASEAPTSIVPVGDGQTSAAEDVETDTGVAAISFMAEDDEKAYKIVTVAATPINMPIAG